MNVTPPTAPQAATRMGELDALRGLAALAVVGFHYSVRYPELMGTAALPWGLRGGQYGVEFFFGISGFVILMTLERCHRVSDFLISRVSRLYPAYWAAVLLTFAVLAGVGLPGREVGLGQMLVNLTMLQGLVGVPHVDGVYWSLEIELIFYGWMLLLYLSGQLARIRLVMLAWVLLSIAVPLAARVMPRGLPEVVWTALLLPHIAMFAVGVSAFRAFQRGRADGLDAAVFIAACASAGLWDGAGGAWACVATAGAFALFVAGRLQWLRLRPLLFLGAISYTLYLLHQNVGYAVMRALAPWVPDLPLRMSVAFALSVLLAAGLTYGIERPAMRAVRGWYRRRHAVKGAAHA